MIHEEAGRRRQVSAGGRRLPITAGPGAAESREREHERLRPQRGSLASGKVTGSVSISRCFHKRCLRGSIGSIESIGNIGGHYRVCKLEEHMQTPRAQRARATRWTREPSLMGHGSWQQGCRRGSSCIPTNEIHRANWQFPL